MQMTSLYILELLQVHATFNLPKRGNEKKGGKKWGGKGGGVEGFGDRPRRLWEKQIFASDLDASCLISMIKHDR